VGEPLHAAAFPMPRPTRHLKLAAALAAWVVIYLVLAPRSVLAADALYLVPGVVAMVLMVRVLLARDAAHRRFWLWFAPGVVLTGTGDILWALFELIGVEPTPSPADACYLVGEALIAFALLRGSRAWSWMRSARALIDASVLAAAVLTIGFGVLVAPQVAGEIDAPLALALGYSGLGVLAVVPALLLCLNRRGVPLAILLVACGQVAGIAGDLVYTWLEAGGAYRSGHPVDLLWMADYTLAGCAAVVAMRAPRRSEVPAEDRDTGIVLLLAGLTGLLGYWLIADRAAWVAGVVVFAIAAMAVRLLLTARDNRRIATELSAALAEGERMAVTDPLTGLLNRSAIEHALRAHDGPLGVIALELETGALGFEQRDEVVTAAAGRVRELAGAIVGRTGATELVLLVPEPAAIRAHAERLRADIAGEPFAAGAVGACVGVAWARDASGEELLRAAEQARELARELGGNQVRAHGDTLDVALLESIADEADRRRGCEGHGRAVGRWAAAVAEQLGLDQQTRDRCELAGRLHDVGLISAPDAVLRRPHLTPRDDLVRLEDHPLAGPNLSGTVERAIAGAAPAILRHHEMLAANPPLEARIVGVCNAWASLREGRAGRIPLGVEAARAQLLTRSGTAYDRDVVRAFLNLELTGAVGGHEAEDLSPVRVHAADEILAATASSAAAASPAPAPAGRSDASRVRRAPALVAAALVVLVGWTAWSASHYVAANRQGDRKADLVEADRALHELQRLRAGKQGLTPTARRYRERLSVVVERSSESAGLREAARSLVSAGALAEAAKGRGDKGTAALLDVHIGAELVTIDSRLDGEIDRATVQAADDRGRAWRLTAGTGVLALLLAGVLLIAAARSRRTAERQRTDAARAAGERAALLESERRFRALVQHASDSVLVIDEAGLITFVTDAIESLLGRPAATLRGSRFDALVDPAHRGRLGDLLVAARRMPDAAQGHVLLQHAAGHSVDADLRVADRVDDPDVSGVVLTLRDVSEQRELESELRRSALVDPRTGLANRARFERWLHDALARGVDVATVQIDLDDFKTINDSLGHPAGDRCLTAYAERLREAVGGSGRIARLGSDEFAVLFEGVTDPESAEALARGLTEAAAGAVRLDGTEVPLTASAGVSLSSPGDLAEDVLRGADTAAHAAKARGAGQVVVYTPSMHAGAVRRLGLRSALASAVERRELDLAYQPIVSVESGETTGLETLLRWRTSEGEAVSPADFIPVAEASGLIVPLGAWVLERACADAVPLGDLTVAVNVSAVQLRTPDFVGTVAGALERSGLPAERLVVELTESALMDDVAGVRDTFEALRALGVRIAIDDFGTGFSSLATLADLPVDVLKLDRSFINAMVASPAHQALVGGVVSLADRMGLPVVAEGVETAEQFEALRTLGCRWAQGYHLGRPGPLAAVDARTAGLR
jgi:diguanylate cyclase (GGDEF)-like protein/PAS domain S-box-containing protein